MNIAILSITQCLHLFYFQLDLDILILVAKILRKHNARSTVRWRRYTPYLGFHHLIQLISLTAIILWCKSLPL
jgi:hypothetical protein